MAALSGVMDRGHDPDVSTGTDSGTDDIDIRVDETVFENSDDLARHLFKYARELRDLDS